MVTVWPPSQPSLGSSPTAKMGTRRGEGQGPQNHSTVIPLGTPKFPQQELKLQRRPWGLQELSAV